MPPANFIEIESEPILTADPPAQGSKFHAQLQVSANAGLRDSYGLFNVAAGPANERPLLFIHNREKP
jgi:hypothetical protein